MGVQGPMCASAVGHARFPRQPHISTSVKLLRRTRTPRGGEGDRPARYPSRVATAGPRLRLAGFSSSPPSNGDIGRAYRRMWASFDDDLAPSRANGAAYSRSSRSARRSFVPIASHEVGRTNSSVQIQKFCGCRQSAISSAISNFPDFYVS